MGAGNAVLYGFNRGLISRLALARTDLKRTALSAQIQDNWMPRALGSMMLRPGTRYISSTLSNQATKHIPFIKAIDDQAIIELTNGVMRVLISEAVLTRVSVTTTIGDGSMSGSGSWTDNDETGATSTVGGGQMILTGTEFNRAIRRQTITVSGGNISKEHALRIHVRWGPVTLKVGSADDTDDYVAQTDLMPGDHSIAFTPSGNAHIQFSNIRGFPSIITTCTLESAGEVQLTSPWATADLPNIRYAQSADVVFVACSGQQQCRIERRGTGRSWSIARYQTEDGPFRLPNTDAGLTLQASATTGQVTVTSSKPLFSAAWANTNTAGGALLKLVSVGQDVTSSLSGADQFTSPEVKVTGLGQNNGRQLTINISGTWSGKLSLQRSVSAPGSWSAVKTFTSNQTDFHYEDGQDNQIIYYRIGFVGADYTSGTAVVEINFPSGSVSGVVRVTDYASPTQVTGNVVQSLGGTAATSNWSESVWSDHRGWPTAVALYEGRLWWAGKDKINGSVSDAFDSFDDATIGDSGPLNRTIGQGPVDFINWILPLQRLLLGAAMAEHSVRSSTFDEPLTPTQFNIKEAATNGSLKADALKVDTDGIFIQRSGRRIYRLSYNWTLSGVDYVETDLTQLVPDIGLNADFTQIAVQRQPDTRIHAVRSNGHPAVLIYDPAEDVQCWVRVLMDQNPCGGTVEEVFTLPGAVADEEDLVYYVVNRTINGGTKRYLERWAREDECKGGTLNKNADAHIVYQGGATTTISGLSHLEGQTVVCWADGQDRGTFTVSSGTITLPVAVSNAVVGLGYSATFQSAKLAYAAQLGTALTQRKKIDHLGLILADTHAQGLQYGPDATRLDPLPQIERGAQVDQNSVWAAYDADMIEFPGSWDSDSRLYLLATAPRPCTVLAAVIGLETKERV